MYPFMTPQKKRKDDITVLFKYNNKIIEAPTNKDETILTAAHKNKIPLEGACEGSLACSTCQVYVNKDIKGILENISDKENDLLDKAYNVKENSRLGCQIKINEKMNKKIFEIPKATINMAIDGYVPQPH